MATAYVEPDRLPTAVQIATAVRAGATTAVEAIARSIAAITAGDGEIGAFQVVRADAARREAETVDDRPDRSRLPLAGVPVAIKDNVPVAGEPMRVGSRGSSAEPQGVDHPVVSRLREAGAVVVGLTRVPELCIFGTTDSAYGTTVNPWDRSRSPGGSSGGSAAAVAAGFVPIAHGNDGMGSIRIPAACCGLVGIKPGLGLVPAELGNGSWFDMAENGPLATTVADCALVLSVLAGRPDLATPGAPSPLRVALASHAPLPATPVDPHYLDAVRRTGEALARAGHTVRTAEIGYPTGAGVAGITRWFAGAELDARQLPDRSRLERRSRRHAAAGRLALSAGLVRPSARTAWQRHAEAFFADHDVLVTPALAQLPLRAQRWSQRGWLANVYANARYAPFASPWNLAGWPALALPAGRHPVGLPLSVQLVAPPGGEATLLRLAAQLEEQRPWPRHPPA